MLMTLKNFKLIIDLQDDIDKVCKWSSDWSTQLNIEKCKVFHIGSNNPKFDYKINSQSLIKSRL